MTASDDMARTLQQRPDGIMSNAELRELVHNQNMYHKSAQEVMREMRSQDAMRSIQDFDKAERELAARLEEIRSQDAMRSIQDFDRAQREAVARLEEIRSQDAMRSIQDFDRAQREAVARLEEIRSQEIAMQEFQSLVREMQIAGEKSLAEQAVAVRAAGAFKDIAFGLKSEQAAFKAAQSAMLHDMSHVSSVMRVNELRAMQRNWDERAVTRNLIESVVQAEKIQISPTVTVSEAVESMMGVLSETLPFDDLPEDVKENVKEVQASIYNHGIVLAVLLMWTTAIIQCLESRNIEGAKALAETLCVFLLAMKDMLKDYHKD